MMYIRLDIRTIIFITAVLQLFCSVGLFLISRSWIKSSALNMVSLAFVCGAIGSLLMSLRGCIGPFWSIVVANVFVLSNPVLVFEGVVRLRGVRPKTRFVGPLFLILLVPVLSYATYIIPHLQARIVVVSLCFALQMVLCVFFLVKGINRNLMAPGYSTAFFFLFAVVIMSLRSVLTLVQPGGSDFMTSGNMASFLQLSHIVYILGVTFGFIWLNTHKLRLSLAGALQDVGDGIHNQFSFVDIIAHELKTPLATIQNSVESLLMRCKNIDPAQERAFGRINRSLSRLSHLIEIGLKQKVFSSEQIVRRMVPLFIVEVVETAIELCKGAFPDHNVVTLYDSTYSGRDTVCGDSKTLLSAFMNVFENAMKFSSSTENIVVEFGKTTSMLTVVIKDNGCGLDPAKSERVFKKYFRAEYKENIPGSGIGLFMVRYIIESHNGTVTIQNRESSGCQVTISLPLCSRE